MLTGIGSTSTLRGSISHDGCVASIRERRRKDGSIYYPLEALIDALRWTGNHHELAEILWVDYFTFVTRVNNLEEWEWRAIEAAVDALEETA